MILDSASLLYHFENFNKWNRVFNIVELSFSIEERSRIRNEYDIFFAYRTIDPFDPRIISSLKKKKKKRKKKKFINFPAMLQKRKKKFDRDKIYMYMYIYIRESVQSKRTDKEERLRSFDQINKLSLIDRW